MQILSKLEIFLCPIQFPAEGGTSPLLLIETPTSQELSGQNVTMFDTEMTSTRTEQKRYSFSVQSETRDCTVPAYIR